MGVVLLWDYLLRCRSLGLYGFHNSISFRAVTMILFLTVLLYTFLTMWLAVLGRGCVIEFKESKAIGWFVLGTVLLSLAISIPVYLLISFLTG